MKTSFWIALVATFSLFGCKSNTTTEPTDAQQTPPQTQQQQQEAPTARGGNAFGTYFTSLMKAFKSKDTKALDGMIDEKHGVFYVTSGQGVYNSMQAYKSTEKLLNDSKKAGNSSPIKYLSDFLNNGALEELDLVTDDMFGVEPCEFTNKGFYEDTNSDNGKLLTDTYTMNLERDGGNIQTDELLKLGDAQQRASKRVLINDGETTYTFYFVEEKGSFKLGIMDMRECQM
jgi:hypothetical protein